MQRTRFGFGLLAGVALGFASLHAGGWGVITLDRLPEGIVAGKPVTLQFAVRAHGSRPVPGLSAWVAARSGRQEVHVTARPTATPGFYAASVEFPRAGTWQITLDSSHPNSRLRLVDIVVSPPSTVAHPLTEIERGRQTFVAKGCASCHTHAAVPSGVMSDVGPSLTDRGLAAEYIRTAIESPSLLPRRAVFEMPRLDLSSDEIASVTAFLTSSSR